MIVLNMNTYAVTVPFAVAVLISVVAAQDINECASNPCLNGGTCTNGCNDCVNSFSCTCAPGYDGSGCEIDIDECASNPCISGDICNDGVNSFTCTCALGYTGPGCDVDINECASDPCENGGTCTDAVNSFTCACSPGFAGSRCETAVNACDSNPCENGGTCNNVGTYYTCDCPPGYSGLTCQEKPPLCPSPEPIARLLDSVIVPQCEENGLAAFYISGSATNGNFILVCHGVYVFNPDTVTREILTTEYCWTQIAGLYKLKDWKVVGIMQGREFPVKDCFIGNVSTTLGITTLPLLTIMQRYLDSTGEGIGCRSSGCMPTSNVREHITWNHCFVISYGTSSSNAELGVGMLGDARKVDVYLDGRLSLCREQVPPDSYRPNDADQTCFVALGDGANCQSSDASAPVFCMTDTDETVLVAFTTPNQNCDETKNTFQVDLV